MYDTDHVTDDTGEGGGERIDAGGDHEYQPNLSDGEEWELQTQQGDFCISPNIIIDYLRVSQLQNYRRLPLFAWRGWM